MPPAGFFVSGGGGVRCRCTVYGVLYGVRCTVRCTVYCTRVLYGVRCPKIPPSQTPQKAETQDLLTKKIKGSKPKAPPSRVPNPNPNLTPNVRLRRLLRWLLRLLRLGPHLRLRGGIFLAKK